MKLLHFSIEMNGIVHYALIAYWEKSGCKIVADYPVNQDPNYRAIALSTLNGFKTLEDDKISVDQGKYMMHVLIGELHYACLTSKPDCPSSMIRLESHSQIFLQRLQKIYRELPILADLSRDLAHLTVGDLSKPLKKMIEEHNNPDDPKNTIPKLEEELTEVRHILMEAVQKLIDRGQRMDELVQKTQSLEISSKDFHVASRTSRKKKNVAVATGAALLMFIPISLFAVLMYMGIL
ncbi:uncharacterized protein [Linepithema humile]|uniref:uncharacterized protein n=1 Tax=Linepithema humile TaxID=83485 RepID=UPI00351E205F